MVPIRFFSLILFVISSSLSAIEFEFVPLWERSFYQIATLNKNDGALLGKATFWVVDANCSYSNALARKIYRVNANGDGGRLCKDIGYKFSSVAVDIPPKASKDKKNEDKEK